MDRVVSLNVGGKVYTASLSILTKYPDSVLSAMFSGDIPPLKDVKGNYVIDRDGKLFRYILVFLRSSKLILPKDFNEVGMLLEEAKFYQLEDLIDTLKKYKIEKTIETPAIFQLNVGGIVYNVHRKYLEPTEDTIKFVSRYRFASTRSNNRKIVEPGSLVLGNLWTTISKPHAPRGENGQYIVDGDGVLFKYILGLVQTKKLNLPDGFSEFRHLGKELKKLGMELALKEFLEDQVAREGHDRPRSVVARRWPDVEESPIW